MFAKGFKKICEDRAIRLRQELSFSASAPLDPYVLAEKLKIKVLNPEQINGLPQEDLNVLLKEDPDSWSAVTVCMAENYLVILNSAHSGGRPASDLMHELSHILIGHKPSRIDLTDDGLLILNTYSQDQEEEANWLSGCLLLPREALLLIKRKKMAAYAVRQAYGVSEDMLNFRLNVSGVNKQFSRFNRFRHNPVAKSI